MSIRASILTVVLLLCALGVGYAVFVDSSPSNEDPPSQAALDDTTDREVEGQRPSADEPPVLSGSADRRMDDFGSGPDGQVVTVPLKDRHRQAYSGSTAGAGGGGSATPSTGQATATLETGTGGVAADARQTSPSPVAAKPAAGGAKPSLEQTEQVANYRVIDRAPKSDSEVAARADGEPDEAQAETATSTPSFDIVRVDPQGNTVLAGRAAPFADVEVKAGDVVIDRVTATAQGEWVSTPTTPLSGGDQELSLVASSEDTPAVVSRQVVVVSIPEPGEQQVADAREPVAILLDKEKGGEGRILQAPGRLQGEGQLALKLVDYDDEGAIKLSGEAPAGVPVRIYIDNEPAALVIGDAKGYWITTLDRDLPGGDYTLRLDQLDKDGETVARLETPLTRVTTPPVKGQSKVDYVVVQPGNSLWRIARRLSGHGFNYVYIFEANQGQIRDPNVIYPGQVFEVPSDAGVAG